MSDIDTDQTDYSLKFEDMTDEQKLEMLAEVNRDRKEMKMKPLKSVADLTRKYAPATLAMIERAQTSVRTRYATPGQKCGRGKVRVLSDKQINFIKFLMSNRDTTNLVRLPGSEDLEFMSLKGASHLIDELLACPVKPGQPTVRMATDKQISYALSLTVRKMGQEKADAVAHTAKSITAADISKIIDRLRAMPDLAPIAVPSTPETPVKLEGMHMVDGRIFKVQKAVHGSGNLYAKELINGSFEYAPGAIRTLSADTKMTLEQAKEYGALYGVCCVCAKTLTDEGSIEAGIGPVCARKFG